MHVDHAGRMQQAGRMQAHTGGRAPKTAIIMYATCVAVAGLAVMTTYTCGDAVTPEACC